MIAAGVMDNCPSSYYGTGSYHLKAAYERALAARLHSVTLTVMFEKGCLRGIDKRTGLGCAGDAVFSIVTPHMYKPAIEM